MDRPPYVVRETRLPVTVVILQPSYIPWRAYFDQIRRADVFMFYDDVQYDRRGWRNRNQYKTHHGKQWLTIPVSTKGVVTDHVAINEGPIIWNKAWNKEHFKMRGSTMARLHTSRRSSHCSESFTLRKDTAGGLYG